MRIRFLHSQLPNLSPSSRNRGPETFSATQGRAGRPKTLQMAGKDGLWPTAALPLHSSRWNPVTALTKNIRKALAQPSHLAGSNVTRQTPHSQNGGMVSGTPLGVVQWWRGHWTRRNAWAPGSQRGRRGSVAFGSNGSHLCRNNNSYPLITGVTRHVRKRTK